MLLINTRPSDRADLLTAQLTAAGLEVKNLPLLQLTACPWNAHLAELYQQLPDTDMIVVVSPTAVRIGMRYLQQAGVALQRLAGVQWIAVGKTTAQVLAEYGIHSHVPAVETSEGMLNLPLFHSSRALQKVAFWRGEGGRQFMMAHLQQQGVQILNFVLYQRGCPAETPDVFAEMMAALQQQSQPIWVLMSSEASWLNWLQLCQQHGLALDACHFLVLGPRLYQLLDDYKNHHQQHFYVSQLANLQPESILQGIAAWQGEA